MIDVFLGAPKAPVRSDHTVDLVPIVGVAFLEISAEPCESNRDHGNADPRPY